MPKLIFDPLPVLMLLACHDIALYSHGVLRCANLAKIICERWKALSKEGRDLYRTVAKYDDIYYHEQLDIMKQASKSQTLIYREMQA